MYNAFLCIHVCRMSLVMKMYSSKDIRMHIYIYIYIIWVCLYSSPDLYSTLLLASCLLNMLCIYNNILSLVVSVYEICTVLGMYVHLCGLSIITTKTDGLADQTP